MKIPELICWNAERRLTGIRNGTPPFSPNPPDGYGIDVYLLPPGKVLKGYPRACFIFSSGLNRDGSHWFNKADPTFCGAMEYYRGFPDTSLRGRHVADSENIIWTGRRICCQCN